MANDNFLLAAQTFSRTIANLVLLATVDFNQHGIINISHERCFNRVQIRLVSVRRNLYAMLQAGGQVFNKLQRAIAITATNIPTRNELRFSVNSNPSVNIAITKHAFLFDGDVLLFGKTKRPNFVQLKAFAVEITKRFVLVDRACVTNILKEL